MNENHKDDGRRAVYAAIHILTVPALFGIIVILMVILFVQNARLEAMNAKQSSRLRSIERRQAESDDALVWWVKAMKAASDKKKRKKH